MSRFLTGYMINFLPFLFVGAAVLGGFIAQETRPTVFLFVVGWFLLVALTGAALVVRRPVRKILPEALLVFLFLISASVVNLFSESWTIRQLIAVVASVLAGARVAFSIPGASAERVARLMSIATAFFGAATLLGLKLFFDWNVLFLLGGAVLLGMALNFGMMGERGVKNPAAAVFGALFFGQLFLVLSFLPLSFYLGAGVLAIGAFLFEEFFLRDIPPAGSKRRLAYFCFALMAALFFSAKWM